MKPIALCAVLLFASACAAQDPPPDPSSEQADAPLVAEAMPNGGPGSVFIEELTWTEIREKIDNGATTVIVPTAGTEQNGPHMVMGKHRYIIEHASNLIARELGNALVAPTMTYVPEGSWDPPSGHMRYAGTITLPNEIFMQVLEATARSLAVHGFTNIAFIGDSGGNQRGMAEVAERLNEEWADQETRVLFIGDYYAANGFREWLEEEGETEETIGGHAGISDTSILMYVAPQHIRADLREPGGGYEGSGVSGDPTRATPERGQRGMELRVDAAVRQIRAMM